MSCLKQLLPVIAVIFCIFLSFSFLLCHLQHCLKTSSRHQRLLCLFLSFNFLLTISSIAQRASVGEKFFESVYYSGMLKRMRKRLLETVTFHMNFDPQKNATTKRRKSSHSPATPPGGEPSSGFEAAADSVFEDDNLEYTSSREFHQMLAKYAIDFLSLEVFFFNSVVKYHHRTCQDFLVTSNRSDTEVLQFWRDVAIPIGCCKSYRMLQFL